VSDLFIWLLDKDQ